MNHYAQSSLVFDVLLSTHHHSLQQRCLVWSCLQVQRQFSSSRGVASFDAFAVSGTLPDVSWEDRSEVINYCPELKTIFPSLRM